MPLAAEVLDPRTGHAPGDDTAWWNYNVAAVARSRGERRYHEGAHVRRCVMAAGESIEKTDVKRVARRDLLRSERARQSDERRAHESP